MKQILITGGTGFIGQSLSCYLADQGYVINILTRDKALTSHKAFATDDVKSTFNYINHLSDIAKSEPIDIIINLAGEPLNSKRWSLKQKDIIMRSRIDTTAMLHDWLVQEQRVVSLLISGSAIGWYGHHGDEKLKEGSQANEGFSHQLCQCWEQQALACNKYAERVVLLRTGIVLEKDGGPLKEMLLPYKLCLGGKLGDGKQMWSWIHRYDLIKAIHYIISNQAIVGPVNATAPDAVEQSVFSDALASVLSRPAVLPMPSRLAQLIIGEFANEVLLNGQHVYPEKLLSNGFEFAYPDITLALSSLLK